LKRKDEVFKYFMNWKAPVEKSSGRKMIILHTDNSGEYVFAIFDEYLMSEGNKLTFMK